MDGGDIVNRGRTRGPTPARQFLRGLVRLLILLVMSSPVVGLQACATGPSGVLRPPIAAPPSDARPVSLLVFSTRAPSDEPGVVYTGERGHELTSVIVDVTLPPNHEPGVVEWPRHAQADPAREFATHSVSMADENAGAAWFRAQETKGHVLVFVHGFNAPFDRAAYSLAQLTVDSGIQAAPILFTWPSRGQVWAYAYDRESASYSRDALETVLRQFVQNPDVTEITLLAHSMGSWIAVEALRQYAIREGRLPAKIQEVILAAPDLDMDVFGQQFLALGDEPPHFTFLVSKDDRALRLSRLLAGGVQRIGAVDPSAPAIREMLEHQSGITIINLAHVRGRDRLNHSVFAESPQVVRLLGGSLASRQNLYGAVQLPFGALILDLAESVTSTLTTERPADHPRQAGGQTSPPPPSADPALP